MRRSVFPVGRVFLAFSVLFFISVTVQAQQTKEITATVKDVTVFLQRAQVFSHARTSVNAGETELVLVNVPANLDANSIQVEATGKITLLGIRYENNYLTKTAKPKEVLQLEDSLENRQNQIRTLNDQIDVYRKEENMVLANQSIGGQKGVAAEDLEDVADFFRKRLFAIRNNILKNEIRLKILNEAATKLRNQLTETNGRRSLPTGRILVTVAAENTTNVELQASYVVYNAGWQPTYDLRAINTKSPMKLSYKANVYQNTGVSWQNVNLTLATSNPSVSTTKPELTPWYLQLYNPRPLRISKAKVNRSVETLAETVAGAPSQDDGWGGEALSKEEMSLGTAANQVSDYTSVTESTLTVNFKISIPYSVPSDGKKHLVDIQEYNVPATYKYAAVPKLTPEAFLMAQLTSWDEYNILPGEANVFMEGTFTGKTYLNPQETGDTLAVLLGHDKRVVISREKVKEYKSKSFLGSTRKETRGFLITVRNTKNETIELVLEDQIPVSNNKEIEVELEDNGGGNLDKTTGKVTWNLTLKPNETKKLPLKFSVKYPKNQQVPGL